MKFSLLVEMSPIKIGGGLIALQKSKNEADKGPMLQASIAASAVKIKIKAFVTVLGISAGANIDVSDNGFEFAISGNLFDVVQADLKIKSKYADIKSASFHVSMITSFERKYSTVCDVILIHVGNLYISTMICLKKRCEYYYSSTCRPETG